MAESTIEANALSIGYPQSRGETTVVASNINVQLKAGELVCLLGPNGAGKSTLMRTLSAMQNPLAGTVLLDGQNIHRMDPQARARVLSVVLTERINVGLLDAYSLVSLGRYPYTNWSGKLTEQDHRIVASALRAVNAEEFANRQVIELSDGERQRVMMARALAQEPRLMVLDEITAFLDLPRRVDIMRTLRQLARETRKAILLSTHDLELALRSADKVWLLPKGGPLQVGTPEELVLNGSFERAFRSEGVDFDPRSGMFRLHKESAGEVEVHRDSLQAIWTARPIERHGYVVVSPGTGADITISVSSSGAAWTIRRNGTERTFHLLEDVLRQFHQ